MANSVTLRLRSCLFSINLFAVPSIAVLVAAWSGSAKADIVNFQPGSYNYFQTDAGNPAQLIGTTGVQIVTGGGQHRSLWFHQRQTVSQFAVQFTMRVTGSNDDFVSEGLTFVLQNAAAADNALPGNTRLGYAPNDGDQPIAPSVGITTEVVLRGSPRESYSGIFFNGNISGVGDALPVNVANEHLVRVNIVYDGQLMTRSYTDLQTGDTWTSAPSLIGSISTRLGTSSAIVGFTAGSNSFNAAIYINDFSFSAIPGPATGVAAGLCALLGARRRR